MVVELSIKVFCGLDWSTSSTSWGVHLDLFILSSLDCWWLFCDWLIGQVQRNLWTIILRSSEDSKVKTTHCRFSKSWNLTTIFDILDALLLQGQSILSLLKLLLLDSNSLVDVEATNTISL